MDLDAKINAALARHYVRFGDGLWRQVTAEAFADLLRAAELCLENAEGMAFCVWE